LANTDSHQTSYIRQKAEKREIIVSPHALENMGLRKIWLDEALEAIVHGAVIDIQAFEEGNVKVIFQQSTEAIPRFAVVVAADYPEVVIVTVYNFEKDKFEYIESQKRWRRK
jgi:hypothetical protein